MTREEKSWVLYDVANSAFVLIIVTTLIPIFFKEFACYKCPDFVSTARLGFGNSIASLLVALLAPILGTMADFKGYKKKLFINFLMIGLFFTLLLGFAGLGQWLFCLIIFVMAKIGWLGANIFYDSFLVDITPVKNRDMMSAHGYAWGYIGSVIPFLMVIFVIFFFGRGKDGEIFNAAPVKLGFILVFLWWLIFSIPILKNIQQKYYIKKNKNTLKNTIKRLRETLMKIRDYKKVLTFLMAYFFYIDGVNTIITMSAAYGMDVGLDITTLILVILMVQIVSFPFVLIYGKLAKIFSARKMIMVGIMIYLVITILAFFLPEIQKTEVKKLLFWIISFLVATSMGGIQALSRSYFSTLIPQDCSGEFFGFYNIFGKFALILGPFLMGLFTMVFGHSRFGILSILILFILGGFLLIKVGKIKDHA